jgi:cholesterol oxidase
MHGRGVVSLACRNCGECNFGCNDNAKNTLDRTYLVEAKAHKAEISPLSEVRSFDRHGEGYSVTFVSHKDHQTGVRHNTRLLPTETITAKRVILAAGALGTSFLLHKNRTAFPRLGGRLGRSFSGNGDMLKFLRLPDEAPQATVDPAHGPVIVSSAQPPEGGLYLQDGGYPQFINWMVGVSDAPQLLSQAASIGVGVAGQAFKARFRQARPRTDSSKSISRLLSTLSLPGRILPLLAMGLDSTDAYTTLVDGKLLVEWDPRDDAPYFAHVDEWVRRLASTLQADVLDPLGYFNRTATVHPLGGCPMGTRESGAVVDPLDGHVWNYPGLHIADGSVMPGPVGANPSLTIAAIAARFAKAIIVQEHSAQERRA